MKLVIATTTYFGTYQHVDDPNYRRHLWDLYCDSLEASNLEGHDVTLLVRDDNSAEIPRMPKKPFSILRKGFQQVGPQYNTILALNEAADMAPYCISVDSDAYFHPDWLTWLSDMIEKFPGASGWNLFNSPWHDKMIDPDIKRNVQNHGLCYRTADRRPYDKNEWVEAYIGNLEGYGFVVPKVSMIQHTGLRGENNVEGVTNDFDPNFPFNDVCGLPVLNSKVEETSNAR